MPGSARRMRYAAAAVYPLVASAVFVLWLGMDLRLRMIQPGVTAWPGSALPEMVDGTAGRPYVQRILLPSIVRAVVAVVPIRTQRRLGRQLVQAGHPLASRTLDALEWDQRRVFEYIVAAAIAYGCLVAFPFAVRELHAVAHGARGIDSHLAGLASILGLPLTFQQGGHPFYDPATLVLWATSLRLIASPHRWPYYIAFTLATLNKETAIVLVLVFALYWAGGLERIALHIGGQVGVWLMIRGAIWWAYHMNPGPMFMANAESNLILMVSRVPWPHYALLGLMLLTASSLGREPRLIRASFCAVGPFVVAYLLVGRFGEVRFFYEVWPVVAILATDTVLRIVARRLKEVQCGSSLPT